MDLEISVTGLRRRPTSFEDPFFEMKRQLKINIPREEWDRLSDRGRQLLRLNPIVNSLDEAEIAEAYSNLYFLEKGSN
jgi:hypothetical protein